MTKYKFNEDRLQFEPDDKPPYGPAIIIALLILLTMYLISNMRCERVHAEPSEPHVVVVDNPIDSSELFSFELFKQYVLDLNLKFPEIVLAQAVLESGNFTSTIWRENNNPFGMKVARSRNTTALGTNRGHAEYKNWRMAVVDYSYLQAVYARKVKTKEGYFEFLNSYAEDPSYRHKLERILKKRNNFGL